LIVNGANRSISGSDALGGINAAMTVALARAGITTASSAAVAAAAQGSTTSTSVSARRFLSVSSLEIGGVPLSTTQGQTAEPRIWQRAWAQPPTSTERAAREAALASLAPSDAWDLDGDSENDSTATAELLRTLAVRHAALA
jgi:hypothetical protein